MKLSLLSFLLVVAVAGGETVQHRGIWLHPEQYKTAQLADEWLGKIAAARLNVIYPLVWHQGGTAWFKSSFSPMATDVPEGFDPLGYLVKAAHARGIHVHAWFVNGSYGHSRPGHVFAQHPDWELQGARGGLLWYDFGKPAVRNFQRDVMLDCLKRYDLDGLHFDYIRYSGPVICYCEHCQNEFAQKYGFRPLKRSEESFPVLLEVGANPLGQPTTAQVLATFDHGVPAIALNRLGAGETVLVNWQAAGHPCVALDNFLTATLNRFGATAKNTYQLHTTQTAAKYRSSTQEQARLWLKELGFPTRLIDETALPKVPKGATVVLVGQYLMSGETVKWLEDFVRNGGHCLFVDGPVFAIRQEPLQRVIGFRGTAKYFRDWKIISPVPNQDILKPGPPVDAAKERSRMEKWVEYRKWTVTELVRAVYRGAKAIKPRAHINAAVFYRKEAADRVCQDWYGWLREGCMDYVLPMAYTEDNQRLSEAFAEWRAFDPPMERIIPGLSIYSRREGKAEPRDLALIRSQLEMSQTHSTRGVQFFALTYLTDPLIQYLAGGPFAQPAQPYYPARR